MSDARSAFIMWLALNMGTAAALALVPSFDASAFDSILQRRTVTFTTYAGVPLAEEVAATRGRVLSAVAREVDAALHPNARFEQAEAGKRVNGVRRGQNQAPYDWQRDGRRVACRSSGLRWEAGSRRWSLQFAAIKMGSAGTEAAFDELLLAAYTPRGIYLHRHNGRLGVSTTGKSTAATGSQIKVFGLCNEEDWASALDSAVLPKLDEECERLAFIPF